MLQPMRLIACLIIVFAVAVASIAAAGVAPMGGAAHQHAMTAGVVMSGEHDMAKHDGPVEAAKCPASIIGCGGIGLTTDVHRSLVPSAAESAPWRPEAVVFRAYEPNLESPPPKA